MMFLTFRQLLDTSHSEFSLALFVISKMFSLSAPEKSPEESIAAKVIFY
jgi:hypothetical protein